MQRSCLFVYHHLVAFQVYIIKSPQFYGNLCQLVAFIDPTKHLLMNECSCFFDNLLENRGYNFFGSLTF
jgi:hypothetical protein